MNKTIFSFWEPQEKMLGYLKLCLRTWGKHLSDYRIVLADYSNLEDLIGASTYDLELLKTLPLPSQKDAAMAAILNRHGGIFMDADTLIGGDIDWILRHLEESEVVMFGSHLAFMAARPGSRILSNWEEGVRLRLQELATTAERREQWDYIGNTVLYDSMIQSCLDLPFCRAFDRFWRARPGFHSASQSFLQKLANQRRWLIQLPAYRRYLRMLSPKKYGFLAETRYFGKRHRPSTERYAKFWFDPDIEVAEVFRGNPSIVGLHNSWTPQWYRDLSEEEALGHEALLSRTFRNLLDK